MKKMTRKGVIVVLIAVFMVGVFDRSISVGAETLASAEQTGTALTVVPERWMTTDQLQKLYAFIGRPTDQQMATNQQSASSERWLTSDEQHDLYERGITARQWLVMSPAEQQALEARGWLRSPVRGGAPASERVGNPLPVGWDKSRVSSTGDGDSPDRPDFWLSMQEQKDLLQDLQAEQKWLASQPDGGKWIDGPLGKASGLQSVASETLALNIPYRIQENGYYCGPASTQMILDYDWGFTGSNSKYTQTFINTHGEGATPTAGTSSDRIVTFLNTYGYPPKMHWTRDPISTSSDETTATTWLYNSIRFNITNNSGTITGVYTCDERLNANGTHKQDAWGRDQRLWGWDWTPHQHFIVEYGVQLDASNRHWISYIDPWNQNSYTDPATGQFEQTGGPRPLDAAVVAHLLIYNTGYLVRNF
ncbi:MAG: C39 family peptidase [Candidatus Cryosericum sp.]